MPDRALRAELEQLEHAAALFARPDVRARLLPDQRAELERIERRIAEIRRMLD